MAERPAVAGGALQVTTGQEVTPSVPRAADTTAVVFYLRDLIARCDGPVPLVDELTEADLGTPRATAAIARAALSVLRSKDPAVIRADVERELAENNWLTAWRLRRLSGTCPKPKTGRPSPA